MTSLTEREAIELYDKAGAVGTRFAPVRWPDVSVEKDNLLRLCAGVLGARCDFAREAFGPDFESDELGDRLDEVWRSEAAQVRFAPEGVFIRAIFLVRVELTDEEGEVEMEETLNVEAEICLSFSTRRHARPFVDLMSGRIIRASDGAARRLDPCGFMVEPQDAVGWGLNGLGA